MAGTTAPKVGTFGWTSEEWRNMGGDTTALVRALCTEVGNIIAYTEGLEERVTLLERRVAANGRPD